MKVRKDRDESPYANQSCEVDASDLKRLDAVHRLLEALRDPYASNDLLEHRVSHIPVLAARIVRHARRAAPSRTINSLGSALAVVGNRGLEAVLLELLEDLTVLRADVEGQT